MTFMFRHLIFERHLAVVDLETIGVDVRNDHLVEVGVLKFAPDAGPIRYRRLVDPGVPIPAAARAVHEVAVGDLTGYPRFRAIAPRLTRLLDDADLVGFNIRRLDLPSLAAEFARAGVECVLAGRAGFASICRGRCLFRQGSPLGSARLTGWDRPHGPPPNYPLPGQSSDRLAFESTRDDFSIDRIDVDP